MSDDPALKSAIIQLHAAEREMERLRAVLERIADDSWDSARDLKEMARAALA